MYSSSYANQGLEQPLRPGSKPVRNEQKTNDRDRAIALQLQQVSIAFNGETILVPVTLDIYPNQLTCLIGPSGCGKSSLLRSLNRLNDLIPSATVSGTILLYGQPITQLPDVVVRRTIGMVFQRPNPFPKSIYENIALGLRINRFQGQIDEQVERSLRQVGLWDEVKDDLRKNALNLSLGQQQRLCIARAIALGSNIILMDEPCASLDPISSERINLLLNEMKQQYTLIVVTHNLKQAASIADWVAFFNIGIRDRRRVGYLAEYSPVPDIFVQPRSPETRDYIYHHSSHFA